MQNVECTMRNAQYTMRNAQCTGCNSSFGRGEPMTFPVGGVIPGWTEALLTMKPGGKVWLVIPSKLAYGKRGAGGDIGPDEDLVFYMELLAVK